MLNSKQYETPRIIPVLPQQEREMPKISLQIYLTTQKHKTQKKRKGEMHGQTRSVINHVSWDGQLQSNFFFVKVTGCRINVN